MRPSAITRSARQASLPISAMAARWSMRSQWPRMKARARQNSTTAPKSGLPKTRWKEYVYNVSGPVLLCNRRIGMGRRHMQLSRIVIKGYRSLKFLDIPIVEKSSCIIGENNTGKSNLVQALRLCLDVNLSSSYRSLLKDDVHCEIDQNKPFQVLIGVEFTDFEDNDAEVAMLHGTQIGGGRARIFYRFRPKRPVREALEGKHLADDSLTLADYSWELSCSPFQAAGAKIPCLSFKLFSMAATGQSGRHDHETTVDHALIRGLVTAGPVIRRGASSV